MNSNAKKALTAFNHGMISIEEHGGVNGNRIT